VRNSCCSSYTLSNAQNVIVSVLKLVLEPHHLKAVLEVLHELFIVNALVTVDISAETQSDYLCFREVDL